MNEWYIRIVILNYNEPQFTADLVNQLGKQTYTNTEIVVVDNASEPQHREMLHRLLPPHVYTIYSPLNIGYSRGNNLGLRLPSSREIDYHLVLNNDIVIEDPDFIRKMAEGLNHNAPAGAVAGSPLVNTVASAVLQEQQIQVRRVLSKNQMFKLATPVFTPFIRKLTDHFVYRSELPYRGKYMICDSVNGAAFIIEDKFLRDIDFLDEGTFLYYEELILGRQIKDLGKTCFLNGYTEIKHLQGVSTKSRGRQINVQMERYKYESTLYYLKKYEGIGIFAQKLFILLNEFSIVLKKLLR
ncbi:glycosyltransferase family 2 protein [Kaistella sp. PBT33-4]|uniref:glycosyltransferase family 2 protein n=1 Tax=Kaistella sp. PBT33-4 TaxID=3032000 RepID=UPI0023D89A06|nr:glycosyltransferase family 2 protein [Kaistella sp. PBT33-4]MDF0718812.1 glycosyltransferase family 2 protein [Kaistella sp. PBT33-4]